MRASAPTSAAVLRPGTPEQAGMAPERIRHLTALGEEWVQQGVAPGMALFVARRGLVVFHEAFGLLAPGSDSPKTPRNALFPIASITKVITATALMVLVEEGRVGLNRPVSGYVPEFRGENKDRVLVRHLLTHTTGIREEDVEKYAKERQGTVEFPRNPRSIHPLLDEFLALRYECPLWKAPGEEMSYADLNFELAAEIVRRTSHTSLDRFAHARIFEPLAMHDTYYCRVDAPQERRVRRAPPPGYVADAIDNALENDRLEFGGGGVLSTVSDLGILGQMFLNRGVYGLSRVLSPASVAAMTRNQIPGVGSVFLRQTFREATWGLGWSVHGSKSGLCGGLYSPEAFEHWGAGAGYLWVDPTYEIVGVYLSSAPWPPDEENVAKHWRNDLFTDAVTAAVVDR